MGKHRRTLEILEAARAALEADHPMTLRQVFYRLVSGQVIENTEGAYKGLSRILVDARREGVIPWAWVEDRLRQPRHVPMWAGLAAFAQVAQQYRRDVWPTQPGYIECWLEKDALSGLFEGVLSAYGVTLNVGRGYDGWSSVNEAAERFGDGQGVTVLYFGDFDPSGEDMVRSLRERLADRGSEPEIIKCALTADDVARYHLPPAPTKRTDSRRARFVARHGDRCVELDALPGDVLRARIRREVEARMDLGALAEVQALERQERARLVALMRGAASAGQ